MELFPIKLNSKCAEAERAESNGDREDDRFLRKSLISSASFSQGIRNVIIRLRLFRISSRVGRRQNNKLSFRSDANARDHCQRTDPIKITRNTLNTCLSVSL
jgi:hypothetical protein